MSSWGFLSDYFSWLSPNENTNESNKNKEDNKINNNANKSKSIDINSNTKRVKKYNPNIKSQEKYTNAHNTTEEDPLGMDKEIKKNCDKRNIENEEKDKNSNKSKDIEKETKKEGGLLNQLGITNWLSSCDLSAMNDYKKGYYLDEEAKNVLPKKNTKKSNVIKIDANGNPEFPDKSFINNENRLVVDTTYYDSLKVSPSAKLNEIKNSYYKLALKYHPDKNKEDPEAKVKFQEISEAYQVLSDEGRRAKYDRYGVKATKDMILIDPSIFFMMLFSSEELISYTGTLRIAFFVQMAFEGNMAIEDKKSSNEALISELETEQTIREVQLALNLRKRLEPYVQNDENWVENMENEIKNLLESSFSSSILESIGWTYENVATSFIAEVTTLWGVGATVANIQAASRTIGNTFCAAKSVINTVVTIKDISGKHEKRSTLKMGEMTANTQNNQHLKDSPQNDNKKQAISGNNGNIYEKTATVDKERGNVNDANADPLKTDDNFYSKRDSNDINENLMNAKSFGKDENKALGSIIKNVLTLVLWDIESTVRQAATKVVRDEEVDIHKRLKRAEGMKLLGQLMQKWARTKKDAGDVEGSEEMDATKLLENALIKAAQMAGDEEAQQNKEE